ncbi:MAG: PEP-CTERM sorting domain-containing protein, partial [Tepidisphaerales bacterium]
SFTGSVSVPGSAATAVYLDEFTRAAAQSAPVQTIAMPTVASGSDNMLTESGSDGSEGLITRSVDGSVIIVPGYNGALGTAAITTSSPGSVARTIGLVDASGTVDTSRIFQDSASNDFRSAASDDARRFWVSTQGNSLAPGLRLYAGSGTTSTPILLSKGRDVGIFGGRLFVSASSSTPGIGIFPVGTGLPTSLTSTGFVIASASGSGSSSPYQFVFFDLNSNDYAGTGLDTLYIADDRDVATGGGLQKWAFDGTNWSLQYILTAGLPTGTAGGLRGLAGDLVNGNVVLFATDAGTTSGPVLDNALWTVTDTGPGSTFSKIIDSPENTYFRGVSLAPVALPEPGAMAMLGVIGLGLTLRRRQV